MPDLQHALWQARQSGGLRARIAVTDAELPIRIRAPAPDTCSVNHTRATVYGEARGTIEVPRSAIRSAYPLGNRSRAGPTDTEQPGKIVAQQYSRSPTKAQPRSQSIVPAYEQPLSNVPWLDSVTPCSGTTGAVIAADAAVAKSAVNAHLPSTVSSCP